MTDKAEMIRLRAESLSRASGNRMTATPGGAAALAACVEKAAEEIRGYVAAYKKSRGGGRPTAYLWLKRIPAEVSALIGGRAILDGVGHGRTLASLAVTVGRLLCAEAGVRDACRGDKAKKGLAKKIARNRAKTDKRRKLVQALAADAKEAYADRKEAAQVGAAMIEAWARATGVIAVRLSMRRVFGRPRSVYVVSITDEFATWLKDYHAALPALRPVFLPMTSPPTPWTCSRGGGVGMEYGRASRLVSDGTKYQARMIDDGACPAVLDAVNYFQSVKWRIAEDVRQVAAHLWAAGGGVGGLPSAFRQPFPVKPTDADPKSEAMIRWRRAAAAAATQNDARKGRCIAVAKTLWAAERLGREPHFYYAGYLDFRGRLYSRSSYLHPQGSDLERGLLEFAEGRKIDGPALRWLKIHTANCFGVDKVSFDERVAWFEEHAAEVLKVGDDPLANLWWTEADSPWQFLAACLDYWRYHAEGPEYVSRLPVTIDGSNNGLQLYSLLTNCESLARATNVLPPGDGKPADLYARVAEAATENLRAAAKTPGPQMHLARWWAEVGYRDGLPRSLVKRAVMTLPYGVTVFSARKYVVEFARDDMAERGVSFPLGTHHYEYLTYLGDLVWASIQSVVPEPMALMAWLQALGEAAARDGRALIWRSPSGFPVVESYLRERRALVETSYGDKVKIRRRLVMREPVDALDPKRMATATAPNFVHSLDAAILVRTLSKLKAAGVTSVSTVHDAFAVPAGDMELLATAVREAVVECVKADPLADFRAAAETPPPIGEVPIDLDSVLQSPYIFA